MQTQRRIVQNSYRGCTAIITVKGNVMKQYGNNTYYLKSGQEFEIQLNNLTKDVVAARIFMNGKAISQSRIILRPGQKVHLDRYLDTPKRFLFDTYEVSDDIQTAKAIADNGNVEIKFYKEKTPTPITYIEPTVWSNNGMNSNFFQNSNSFDSMVATSYSTSTTPTYGGQHTNSVSKSLKSRGTTGRASASMSMFNEAPEEKFRETGRVEQGSDSKQRFKDYVGEFEYTPFDSVSIKLLPVQYKPVSVSVLAEYCVKCGTKNKKGNYIHCPKCGTKY